MKRHTLAERIRDETGLTVKEFTAQLGIKPDVLLKIILAGYRAEVRGEVVGLA